MLRTLRRRDGRTPRSGTALHPPAYYGLILLGFLPYALVASAIQHTGAVEFGLCATHAAQARRWRWLAGGSLTAGVTLIVGSIALLNAWVTGAGLALVFAGVVPAWRSSRLVRVTRMDARSAWLHGASPALVGGGAPEDGDGADR